MALTRLGPNQAVNLSTNTTGTLGVANGGTGLTSGTTDQILKFTGSTTLASSAISTGKIGQVVHTKDTTYRQITTNSFVECINVTITPSATSSKILVFNSAHLTKVTNDAAAIERMYRVVGGSDVATQVLSDHTAKTGSTNLTNSDVGYAAFQWYDEPSSTAAITYDYRMASQANNANVVINNYHSAGSFSSQLTAMEILA